MARNDRAARGKKVTQQLFGPQGLPPASGQMKPFMDLTNDYLFGEVWTRPGLAMKERSRITCAVLAAFGREAQLKGHLKGALNLGLKPAELREVLIHVAHYAGWSTGVIGLKALDEAIAERADAARAAKAARATAKKKTG